MSKVERNILKQQFKKTYSIYSQALLKTVNDNDGTISCYYGEDENEYPTNTGQYQNGCPEFFENFAQNLKIIKKCEGNALADGCVPVYSSYQKSSGCTGTTEEAFNIENTVYVLADGSMLMPYRLPSGGNMAALIVDINGKKGPNKAGFDLFNLNITRTAKGLYRINTSNGINGCLPYLDGRLTYDEIMFE